MTYVVGDKVRYVGSMTPDCFGLEGTVVSITGPSDISVDFGLDRNYGVLPSSLELIRPSGPQDTILDEAKGLVYGNRGTDYGHPAVDYDRVAKIWSGILGVDVTRLQAIQCMIGIKLSRLSNTPHHHDSWVDIAGYAECGNRVVKYEQGDENS